MKKLLAAIAIVLVLSGCDVRQRGHVFPPPTPCLDCLRP